MLTAHMEVRPAFDNHAVDGDRTVLIVEDDDIARHALGALLQAHGYHTVAAASGEEALEHLGDQPNSMLALIDLDLPGMDGAEFVRHLRRIRPRTRAIMITAASRELVRQRVAGDVLHLRKPFDLTALLAILAEHSAW